MSPQYQLRIKTVPHIGFQLKPNGEHNMLNAVILAAALTSASAPHYRAEPVSKPAESKIVLRDTMWNCGDSGCVGTKSGSRPAIICAVLVKRIGPLRSFHVAGEALAPTALEACNARAN
jgi:hypothetical protein